VYYEYFVPLPIIPNITWIFLAVNYERCSKGCCCACKKVSYIANFETQDRHMLEFPLLPCMDSCLEICPQSFSCSQCVCLLSLKFNKDFVYKMILLTMINFQGSYKMMFSVQFMAEFSRMKFYQKHVLFLSVYHIITVSPLWGEISNMWYLVCDSLEVGATCMDVPNYCLACLLACTV